MSKETVARLRIKSVIEKNMLRKIYEYISTKKNISFDPNIVNQIKRIGMIDLVVSEILSTSDVKTLF